MTQNANVGAEVSYTMRNISSIKITLSNTAGGTGHRHISELDRPCCPGPYLGQILAQGVDKEGQEVDGEVQEEAARGHTHAGFCRS